MKRTAPRQPGTSRSTTQSTPQPRPLPSAERAELQRQGAKAAVRGDASHTNPMEQPHNQPPATGEHVQEWTQRSDAWVQGHEAATAARRRQRSVK